MSSYIAPGNVQFSYAQLEYIWCQANGNPQSASIAAAIAMAESGGNSTATDLDANGSTDRGLWQINSVHGSQSTYDVMGNARAAVSISNNGQNWQPWTTYTSGAYQRYLQGNVSPSPTPVNATNAQAQLTGVIPQLPQLPGGGWDPFNWGTEGLNWFTSGINNNINSEVGGLVGTGIRDAVSGLRTVVINPLINLVGGVLGITAGGIMVGFGIFMVVRQSDTGRAAENIAGQAAVSAIAPETTAVTEYTGGASGAGITRVSQTRKPAGRIGRVQYRPARSKTTVERPPRTPKEALRDEANGYNNRAGGADAA